MKQSYKAFKVMYAHRVKTLTPSLKKPGHTVTGKSIKDQGLSTRVR